MSTLRHTLKACANNPGFIRFIALNKLGYYKNKDAKYLQDLYKLRIGKTLDLDNPKSFNEKIQWLKLYDKNPIYTELVDKYRVKEYVSSKIGAQYIIPTIGVWDSANEIDFQNLPEEFVLKCNHNSGGIYICKNKELLSDNEIEKIRLDMNRFLKQDYYINWREWPYKDVKRKIIAEPFMKDNDSDELIDYKFMCFNGNVKCSFTCTERFSEDGLKVTFFDRDWNVMPFERHYPKSKKIISKPVNYDLMIKFSEVLSKDIPFVRMDFYEINGRLFFGEYTFYPGSGFEEFSPEHWDNVLGSWLTLPDK